MEKNETAITAFEDNKKLSNQLGYYIGEYIIMTALPTLSCDFDQNRRTVNITDDEQKEYTKVNELWYKKTLERDEKSNKASIDNEWKERQKYRKYLTEKYISETIKCDIPVLDENGIDIKLFKEGIAVALWDSDISHYSCDPNKIEIHFAENGFDFPYIKLVREFEEVG